MDLFKKLFILNGIVIVALLPVFWVMYNHSKQELKKYEHLMNQGIQQVEHGTQNSEMYGASQSYSNTQVNQPVHNTISGSGEILNSYADASAVRLILFDKNATQPIILESPPETGQGLILKSLVDKKGMIIHYQGVKANTSHGGDNILTPTAIWY